MTKRKFTIEPTQDRVLIKIEPREVETESGIIIPNNVEVPENEPGRGVVVAVGPGLVDDEGDPVGTDVEPGDLVLFAKYAGARIKVESVDHLIMREEEILAILR
jgi:chaperonin GroES